MVSFSSSVSAASHSTDCPTLIIIIIHDPGPVQEAK
jgi:hypothetical protein